MAKDKISHLGKPPKPKKIVSTHFGKAKKNLEDVLKNPANR